MFLTRSDNNIIVKEWSKVFSEGLLAVNESETFNCSFTIILTVHQPYSIMLHVTYVYIMQAHLQTAYGPETLPHFLPDLSLGVSVPYIYRERVHWISPVATCC